MAIVTHAGVNRQLTYEEVDNNFAELDARTAIRYKNVDGVISTDGIANAAPKALYNNILYLLLFEATVSQECTAIFHIPNDYVAGTDLIPFGNTIVTTTAAGNVRWGFTISMANLFDGAGAPDGFQVYGAGSTAYVNQSITASDLNANRKIAAPFNIVNPGLLPGAIVMMRVFRDSLHVDDTYPDNIHLTNISLTIQAQGFGAVTP